MIEYNLNSKVNLYLTDGCGRCKLAGTLACKVHKWQVELDALRYLVLSCDLVEDVKWGVPCYTWNNKNIVLIHAFKEYCALLFMKGSLLKDYHGILYSQTDNIQSGRQLRFTNVDEIIDTEEIIKEYILEAISIEKSGAKIPQKKTSDIQFPEELLQKFEELPAFKKAFYALTPGRQRGYLYYFLQAKQSKTRDSRIESNIDRIMNGKGMYE